MSMGVTALFSLVGGIVYIIASYLLEQEPIEVKKQIR
jgi:phage shock protein PspC (stress-responsive transcriptional regulator)